VSAINQKLAANSMQFDRTILFQWLYADRTVWLPLLFGRGPGGWGPCEPAPGCD